MLRETLSEILKTQALPPVAPHEVGWEVEAIAEFGLKKLTSATTHAREMPKNSENRATPQSGNLMKTPTFYTYTIFFKNQRRNKLSEEKHSQIVLNRFFYT
jgi:hypothetical protein